LSVFLICYSTSARQVTSASFTFLLMEFACDSHLPLDCWSGSSTAGDWHPTVIWNNWAHTVLWKIQELVIMGDVLFVGCLNTWEGIGRFLSHCQTFLGHLFRVYLPFSNILFFQNSRNLPQISYKKLLFFRQWCCQAILSR